MPFDFTINECGFVIKNSDGTYTTLYSPVKKKNVKNEIRQMIFNDPATVIKWNDGEKTVVKATKSDSYDPVFGVLMAYFQKHSGMSKTQVGKFCNEIMKEFDRQNMLKLKK